MTRINSGFPVNKLTNKHLIAEHREIKRIPNCIAKGKYSMADQPANFKLGTGHVKFFYDKCGYLLDRYCKLYAECIKRGFNVTNYVDAWLDIPESMMGHYTPTDEAKRLITERINERLK